VGVADGFQCCCGPCTGKPKRVKRVNKTGSAKEVILISAWLWELQKYINFCHDNSLSD